MRKFYYYKGNLVKLIRITYVAHGQQYCTIELPTGKPQTVQMRRLTSYMDERDGCVAGCPECIWGGKFPAKDNCEGYELPVAGSRCICPDDE